MLYYIGLNNDFLDMTPKHRYYKQKYRQLDYIKLKSFYIARERISRMRKQPIE